MMITTLRRLRREENGYALVTAMLLLAVMMIMLVVALEAGNSALRQTSRSVKFSGALTVAEAGVHDMVARLGESRTAASPCLLGSVTVCTGAGGEYQVKWSQSAGTVVVTSVGYYPTKASPIYAREVRVTYEPVSSFRYAIHSQSALDIKNGTVVIGDVYSDGNISIGQGATICGSVISSGGGIALSGNSTIKKADSAYNCSGKSGQVWSGGSGGIVGASTVVIEGNAKASAPSSVTCANSLSTYAITTASGGYTVQGTATACGKITGVSGATSMSAGTATSQPAGVTFPSFTFDPANYDPLTCYPSGGTCGSNDSTTAYSDFQTYVNANKTTLSGTYAVWQRSPSQSTVISLDGIALSGDFALITNAPVTFGNTSTISTTAASSDFALIDTYIPPVSSSCDTNGGDCSIYGKNQIIFDSGSLVDPNDGVVGLLYTTGKMAFDNTNAAAVPGDGALYAAGMDIKNGYNIQYNSRIDRTLGFGQTLQQTLWQEVDCPGTVCPG